MARATGKVSFLRALEGKGGRWVQAAVQKQPERGGPQPLVLIFGEFEQKQVVFFLGPGNQSFQIGDPHFGVEFLVGNLLAQDCDIEGKACLPRQKPKAKKRVWGPSLFPKEISGRPLLCLRSQVIRLHLRESDGNDRGQDRYPKESPSASRPSMQKFWFPSPSVTPQTYSANLTADSMLPILKQAPTNLA